MFTYNKKLQYPVKIARPNPRLAAIIISQYGGPDGELGASLRYLSQRYSMPFDELKGLLTDIGTEELGHDVAMHIAAANPGYLNREQVPTAELEHEKAVLTEQARNEGKPEKIIEKMVLGRIQKYYKEVCLVDQEFVKDPDQTVGKLVAAAGSAVTEFTRFQLGEGIEKKQEDFAAEVMAQIK